MMAEDETKKETQDETPEQETPQEETPQDEAPQDAGPVAEEGGPEAALGSSPEEQEGEAEELEGRGTDAASASDPPSPTPPASEEESSDEADDRPWKEKRRLEKSRRPHKARPQQSHEERKAARVAERKRRGAERRKERAGAKAKKTSGTGTPVAEKEANAAKVRQGIVVSDKGQKSITVRVDIVRRHPTYEKVIRRSRTLHAHDERNEAGEGDVVRVVETRPLSKTKRWRLVEVLEKAK
jgi:small subunit ribosomal protein S17